jgi:hypothetical protein
MAVGSVDPLLGRSVCAAGQPARPQVSRCTGLSVSDRDFPTLTGRSGTQRARRRRCSCATHATSAPWSSSSYTTYALTSVFSCVGRGLNARMSFRFVGCLGWRPLAVDGRFGDISGTRRERAHNA